MKSNNGVESLVQWGDNFLTGVELDNLLGSFSNTFWGELEVFVNFWSWTRGTESVDTKLFVRVFRPTRGSHDFNGHDWSTVWEDTQLVFLRLLVESVEVWQGDNLGLDTLGSQYWDGVNGKRDFGTGGNDDNVSVGLVDQSITTLGGLFDGRTF